MASKSPAEPPTRAIPLNEARRARGEGKVAVPRSKIAATRAFRRVRADRLFGVIGILLVLFGAYLVFNWEKPVVQTPSWAIEWPETRHGMDTVAPVLDTATPTESVSFTVPDVNVTRVRANISWTDDVGDEPREYDVVDIVLQGPDGSNLSTFKLDQSNKTKTVLLEVTAFDVPDLRSVPASSREEAARLVPDSTTRNGTGTWTVVITVQHFYDNFASEQARLAVPNGDCTETIPNVCENDPEQAFVVAFEYFTYRLDLEPAESPAPRENG